jgi:hypothetical protein
LKWSTTLKKIERKERDNPTDNGKCGSVDYLDISFICCFVSCGSSLDGITHTANLVITCLKRSTTLSKIERKEISN